MGKRRLYDLEACEELLKDTYGITVYQEQVMLLSQKLADFSRVMPMFYVKRWGRSKCP
jgi:DNA polymerase III alpha subunit